MNNRREPLFLEMFGYTPEEARDNPRAIAGRADSIIFCMKRAYERPTSLYGRILRSSGAVNIALGSTGRVLAFGQGEAADPATKWLATKREVVDAMRDIIDFAHFAGKVLEVQKIANEREQSHEILALVEKVKGYGGYPTQGKSVARTVGKVFEIRLTTDVFLKWKKMVDDGSHEVDTQQQRLDAVAADGVPGVAVEELQPVVEAMEAKP